MQDVSRPTSGYQAPEPYCHSNGATADTYVPLPSFSQSQYPDQGRNRLTKYWPLFRNRLTKYWPLFRNRLTKYWPQFRNLLTKYWPLLHAIAMLILTGTIIAHALIETVETEPSFPDFEVDSLSLTNFSADLQSLTGTWSIGFLVRNNDERWNVTYNDLRSSVIYKDSRLLEANLVPFTQRTKSENSWYVKLPVINAYVQPDDINELLVERSNGSIRFDFKVLAHAYWFGGSSALNYSSLGCLRVLCNDVAVGILSNSSVGKLTGGARQCRVQLDSLSLPYTQAYPGYCECI